MDKNDRFSGIAIRHLHFPKCYPLKRKGSQEGGEVDLSERIPKMRSGFLENVIIICHLRILADSWQKMAILT
jgi:hypothetical protein